MKPTFVFSHFTSSQAENKSTQYSVLSTLANKKGQSLIQVLVSIGLMSILATVFASMQQSQQKQIKFLEAKQEVVDAKNVLLRIYSGGFVSGCAAANSDVGDLNFPSSSVPSSLSFNKIFDNGSPNPVTYASTATGFKGETLVGINSMSFQNFSGSGDIYTGDLVINISQKNTSQIALKPIIIASLSIQTQDVGTNKQIISCNQISNLNIASTINGFCTPRSDWDNSNTMTCPVLTNYTATRISGVYGTDANGLRYRGSSCCYVPTLPGGDGWCSFVMPSWSLSFSGCGSGNSFYTPTLVQAVTANTYDQSICCFVPNFRSNNAHAFASVSLNQGYSSSDSLAADSAFIGCGGPFQFYDIIVQNTVTANQGRNASCTYVPK